MSDWVDRAIEDDWLREVGLLEPDQPSPWSHEKWCREVLPHRLFPFTRGFTALERMQIRIKLGMAPDFPDDEVTS